MVNIATNIQMLNHSPANTNTFRARKSIIVIVHLDITCHHDFVMWMRGGEADVRGGPLVSMV